MEDLYSDIASKVAINAFTAVFKSCYDGLKKAGHWVAAENKEHDFFGRAATKYVNRIQERYDTVRIFGMSEPVKLRSIFTRVNILEKITSQQRESVEDLEKAFDRDRRGFGYRRVTKPGADVVNALTSFVLLGKPGAGKSTFLKHIALQAAEGVYAENKLPIFVGLKLLSDSNKNLTDFIVDEFDICHFPDAGPFIERVLSKGACILLLDGLDEVPKAKEERLITEILNLSHKYPNNQFILSCRIAAYNYCFEKFVDVEIADFDDSQIKTFVFNWYGEDKRTAELCWEEIEESAPIKELARIPLLLTLLCLAFDENLGFPSNNAELYEEALDALLKRWDSSRRIKREEVYQQLSLVKKTHMFSRIAMETFSKDQYFLKQKDLCKHIADFLTHLPEISEKTIEFDSEAILKAIEAHHGIFVERARGIYSFSHLTFQEYFTAKHIVDNASKGALGDLVNEHLFENKWREVFLITVGLLAEADAFFLLMREKLKTLLHDPKVASFLNAIQITPLYDPPSDQDRMIPRSYFNGILLLKVLQKLRTIDESKRLEYVDSKFCEQLMSSLVRYLYSHVDLNLSQDLTYRYDRDLVAAGRRAEELVSDLDRIIDRRLIASLMRYLHACEIVVSCLNTGCFLTKPVRQKILEILISIEDDD